MDRTSPFNQKFACKLWPTNQTPGIFPVFVGDHCCICFECVRYFLQIMRAILAADQQQAHPKAIEKLQASISDDVYKNTAAGRTKAMVAEVLTAHHASSTGGATASSASSNFVSSPVVDQSHGVPSQHHVQTQPQRKQLQLRQPRSQQLQRQGPTRLSPMWPWSWHPSVHQDSEGTEDVAGMTQRFLSQNPSLQDVAHYIAEDENASDDLDIKLRQQLAGLTLPSSFEDMLMWQQTYQERKQQDKKFREQYALQKHSSGGMLSHVSSTSKRKKKKKSKSTSDASVEPMTAVQHAHISKLYSGEPTRAILGLDSDLNGDPSSASSSSAMSPVCCMLELLDREARYQRSQAQLHRFLQRWQPCQEQRAASCHVELAQRQNQLLELQVRADAMSSASAYQVKMFVKNAEGMGTLR